MTPNTNAYIPGTLGFAIISVLHQCTLSTFGVAHMCNTDTATAEEALEEMQHDSAVVGRDGFWSLAVASTEGAA